MNPSRLELAQRLLADVFASFISLDGYHHTLASLTPGHLLAEPDWLQQAHGHLAALAGLGRQWTVMRPVLLGNLLRSFTDQAACLSAIESMRPALSGQPAQWDGALGQVLLPRLQQGLEQAADCERRMNGQVQALAALHQRLEEALQAGWQGLEKHRKPAGELWRRMSALHDSVNAQERATLEQLKSPAGLIVCRARMVYKVSGPRLRAVDVAAGTLAVAGAVSSAVPYIELVLPVLLKDAAAADGERWSRADGPLKRLKAIRDLQLSLAQPVQALAAQQAILVHLQAVQQDFAPILKKLSLVTRLWREESQAAQRVIDALAAGVTPDSHLYLVNLPAAARSWRALGTLASQLAALKIDRSRSVVLDPLGQSVIPATLPGLMQEVI